jgi:hypothetical protein
VIVIWTNYLSTTVLKNPIYVSPFKKFTILEDNNLKAKLIITDEHFVTLS